MHLVKNTVGVGIAGLCLGTAGGRDERSSGQHLYFLLPGSVNSPEFDRRRYITSKPATPVLPEILSRLAHCNLQLVMLN